MKRLAFAFGLLALSFIASSPARADYAVVQFGDGNCRIWWDSAGNPWGAGWAKVAVGLPDHMAAQVALDTAIAQRVCR
jgi:hypothetical protein